VSRSRIAGVDTMAAQELDAEGAGAQSHLTTERINCGGTAGEEDDVKILFYDYFTLFCFLLFVLFLTAKL